MHRDLLRLRREDEAFRAHGSNGIDGCVLSPSAFAIRFFTAGHLADRNMPASQDHSVRLSQLREAFLALPEEQRSALHLVAIEGLSYAKAADVSGVPLGTLMSRIGRARAALREMEEGAPIRARSHLRIVGDES